MPDVSGYGYRVIAESGSIRYTLSCVAYIPAGVVGNGKEFTNRQCSQPVVGNHSVTLRQLVNGDRRLDFINPSTDQTTLWFVIEKQEQISVPPVTAQTQDKDKFTLRVAKVQRLRTGCTVDASSKAVRYKLSSTTSGPCSILRAGEDYEAKRGTIGWNTGEDTPALLIFNNVENIERPNAVFDIESQEAR